MNYLKFILGFIFCIMMAGMVRADMNISQPVYTLKIEMNGRGGHVLVNGVPVLRNYDGYQVITHIPVTEYMFNGENSLGFEVFFQEDQVPEDARIKATLILRQNGSQKSEGLEITSIGLSGRYTSNDGSKYPASTTVVGHAEKGTVIASANEGLIRLSRTINSSVQLPVWKWQNSNKISNDEKTYNELLEEYKELWNALDNKNIPFIEKSLNEKFTEIANAFYMTFPEALDLLALSKKPIEPGWKIPEPRWDELQLLVVADGRLARLMYYNGNTPLVYYSDDGEYHSFDLWYRLENGHWIITR